MIRTRNQQGFTYKTDLLHVSIPRKVAAKATQSMGMFYDLLAEDLGVSKLEAQTIDILGKRS